MSRRLLRTGAVTAGLLALLPLTAAAAGTTVAARPAPPGVALTPVAQLPIGNGNLGDMAFWGPTMVVAYGAAEDRSGFAVVDVANPERPRVRANVPCEGSTYDVSLWKDLVVVSTESGGPTCSGPANAGWGGVRVFDISNPTAPLELASVPTCNGSHTHTLLPDLDHPDGPRLQAWVSSGPQCLSSTEPGMEVVTIPLDDPAAAAVTGTVPLPVPPKGCHDVTFFQPRALAVTSCAHSGSSLWDVSRPSSPRLLSTFGLAEGFLNINGNHSGAFSRDGSVLLVTEESGGGFANACNTLTDGRGQIRVYDVSDPTQPVQRSTFKIPRVPRLAGGHACTAHYASPVHTTDGSRLFAIAWLGGGTTLLDVTNPARPVEVASYEATGTRPLTYGAYEYNGYVYTSNSTELFVPGSALGQSRGLEVLRLDGVAVERIGRLNPQLQEG